MNRPHKLTVFSRSDARPEDVDSSAVSDATTKLLEDRYLRARDGAKGYREAAESLGAGSMKARLFGIARRRAAMAGQLELSLRSLGIEMDDDATSAGPIHRFFDDLKDKLTTQDDHGIIADVVHGETGFAGAIDKVLEQPLPTSIRNLLERQGRQVRSMVDRFAAELGRESRFDAIRHKVVEYRRPAAIALGVVAVGALAGALVVRQRRRQGSAKSALHKARKAMDRSFAALPSASDARKMMPSLPSRDAISPKSAQALLDEASRKAGKLRKRAFSR
ncbi:MAG: PA2169 family four-helix-bundle protein [Alphaproteobacteria bacterium]|nr:PA2169 family four-helix-bundle protein [Alphaproteobacteria bacterium]